MEAVRQEQCGADLGPTEACLYESSWEIYVVVRKQAHDNNTQV